MQPNLLSKFSALFICAWTIAPSVFGGSHTELRSRDRPPRTTPTAGEVALAAEQIQYSGFFQTYLRFMEENGYLPTTDAPWVRFSSERCPPSLSHCIRIFDVGYDLKNGAATDRLAVQIRVEEPIGYALILNIEVHESIFAKRYFVDYGNQAYRPITGAMMAAGVPQSDGGYPMYHVALRAICRATTLSGNGGTCIFKTLTGDFPIGEPYASRMIADLVAAQVPHDQLPDGRFEWRPAMLSYATNGAAGAPSTSVLFLVER